MSLQVAQLVHSVRELTLVAVLALTRLLEGSAQLRLVAEGEEKIYFISKLFYLSFFFFFFFFFFLVLLIILFSSTH